MDEPFLVTINVSKLGADTARDIYRMFVDNSKMTIVYELAEWIRWLFSSDICFYFTHDGAIIHDLEDIRILSKLSKIDLQVCGSTCNHKKLRKVLKKMNFFGKADGEKVPRLFTQKLEVMKRKWCEAVNNQSSDNENSERTCNTSSFNCEENTSGKTTIPLSNKDGGNYAVISSKSKCSKVAENGDHVMTTKISNAAATTLSYSDIPDYEDSDQLTPEFNVKPNLKDHCANNSEHEPQTNEVVNSKQNKSVPFTKKSKQFIRPFSVGDLLNTMRADAGNSAEESPQNTTPKENKIDNCSKEEIDWCQADFVPQKKRKRLRKHKSKKQKAAEHSCSSAETNTVAPSFQFEPPSSYQPKQHIRFEKFETGWVEEEFPQSVDEEMSGCETTKPSNYLSESKRKIREIKELIDIKMNALREQNAFSTMAMAEENLPQATPTDAPSDYFTNEVVMQSPGVSTQNGELLFQDSNASNDLNELMSLKKKHLGPIVINRF